MPLIWRETTDLLRVSTTFSFSFLAVRLNYCLPVVEMIVVAVVVVVVIVLVVIVVVVIAVEVVILIAIAVIER